MRLACWNTFASIHILGHGLLRLKVLVEVYFSKSYGIVGYVYFFNKIILLLFIYIHNQGSKNKQTNKQTLWPLVHM
jgi:hypothetical protein